MGKNVDHSPRRRAEYLADKCCEHCGAIEGLCLTRKDPTDAAVRNLFHLEAGPRRDAELAKRIILCSKCQMKYWQERGSHQKAPHGTFSKYQKQKCRCVKCKTWKQAYDADYHARNPRKPRSRKGIV